MLELLENDLKSIETVQKEGSFFREELK